jgi:hypothetical protein
MSPPACARSTPSLPSSAGRDAGLVVEQGAEQVRGLERLVAVLARDSLGGLEGPPGP